MYGFCNSLVEGRRKERRSSSRRRHITPRRTPESESCKYHRRAKTDTKSYYTGARGVSGLYDLLSRHHRADGGVQVPLGDIPQVESREGRLSGPHSRLQYLVDHEVPPKYERRRNLPDFMIPDSQRATILL